jgi:predicted membrane protein
MNASFAPAFAPVITHEMDNFKAPIHTPAVKDQRCELAFISVYATLALLAWPLVTLLALAFDSSHELDVLLQAVLMGGLFIGILEYVRCTAYAVLDYTSRYVDCCWNAMTTLNCVLQFLVIFIEGFVFMSLLDSGLFSNSDSAQSFVAIWFYVTVAFAIFELLWYIVQSYESRVSSISLWEGVLIVFSVKLLIVLLLAFLPLSIHNKDNLYSPMLSSLKKTCKDAHLDSTACTVADQLRSEFWLNGTMVQNWPLDPWLCSTDIVTSSVKEQYCTTK